jgi:hypothetical protein
VFVLNHSEETSEVPLPGAARDLLTGREHEDLLRLDPRDVAVLEGM